MFALFTGEVVCNENPIHTMLKAKRLKRLQRAKKHDSLVHVLNGVLATGALSVFLKLNTDE